MGASSKRRYTYMNKPINLTCKECGEFNNTLICKRCGKSLLLSPISESTPSNDDEDKCPVCGLLLLSDRCEWCLYTRNKGGIRK